MDRGTTDTDGTTDPPDGPRPARYVALAFAALYGAAVAVRLLALTSPPHGDEALHFIVARDLGATPDHVVWGLDGATTSLAPFFWQRPLFSLMYAPAAQAGFVGYRLGHVLVSSLLPVLVAGTLRDRDVGSVLTWGSGAIVAVYPLFVVWGVRVFPDTSMAVLFVAGLWALTRGRRAAAVGLLLMSVWVKEVAIVGAVPVLAWMAWTAAQDPDRDPLWSRPVGFVGLVGGFTAAALAPLAVATVVLPGRFPGWAEPITVLSHVDGLFLTAAAIPVLVLGLRWTRSRLLAGLALWHGAFYLTYRVVLGRGLSTWYRVLPGALSLAGVAITVDTWRSGSSDRWPAIAAAVVAGILLVQTVAPVPQYGSTPGKLEEMHAGRDVEDVATRLDASERQDVLLVDVGWFYVYWPFSDVAEAVRYVETGGGADPADLDALVRNATATVVHVDDHRANQAFRDRWADCVAWRAEGYAVVHGQDCAPDGG